MAEIIIIIVIILCIVISYHYSKEKITLKTNYIPNTKIIVNDDLIFLINKYRKEQHLSILLPELKLMETAEKRVNFLISQGTITHDGFTEIDLGTKSLGEIVGKGYSSPLGLFNGYKKSPIHNEIMLKPYKYIGSFTKDTYNCVLFAN